MRIKRPSSRKRKKKQITGTFAITMSGQLLPMQLIYQGTMDCCLAKGVQFSNDWNVTNTANHWSNELKAIQYFLVLFPYVEKRKVELKLPDDQISMLLFDVLMAKSSIKILNLTKRIIVHVPNNLTD